MTTYEHRLALKPGTVIQDYKIESLLGSGGFSLVYKASHVHLDKHFVAIKEFLPNEIATREGMTVCAKENTHQADYEVGLQAFLAEASQLNALKHPNIINCRNFTTANETAYLIMDYEDGKTLKDELSKRERENNPLTEKQIKRLLSSLLSGLAYVHKQKLLHRDIKPGNIYMRRSDDEPVLIDFGIAKQEFSEHSKSTKGFHSVGYAPGEQISATGKLGPWTDIYSVGAMVWRIISGKKPVDVLDRERALYMDNVQDPMLSAAELGKGRYSAEFLEVIDKCLKLKSEDRYQTVDELISALEGEKVILPPLPPTPPVSEPQSPELGAAFWVTGFVAVLASIFGMVQADGKAELDQQLRTSRKEIAGLESNLRRLESAAVAERGRLQQGEAERIDAAVKAERRRLVQSAGMTAQEQSAWKENMLKALALAGDMKLIPSGRFDMGSNDGEDREKPVHRVDVPSFLMGETEVTEGQFRAFVDDTDYKTTAEVNREVGCNILSDAGWGDVEGMSWRIPGFEQTDTNPVVCVSYNDATAYINWLNSKSGVTFRLPSEAEWEYAARAGTTSSSHFGNDYDLACTFGNINDSTPHSNGNLWTNRTDCSDGFGDRTAPVSNYQPNGFGLYDMVGNVQEWVQDCYFASHLDAPADGSARESITCRSWVIRGSSWGTLMESIRSAARYATGRTISSSRRGFRIALDL